MFKQLTVSAFEDDEDPVEFRTATDEDTPWVCRNMAHQGEKAEKLAREHLHDQDITIVGALKKNPPLLQL